MYGICLLTLPKISMLNKNISHSGSSGRINLGFDGSVMPGDVDIMWKSVCQVSVSQLVLVCYEPQFIPQIYSPCGSKCIERHCERTFHCFSQCSNCTTSTVVGYLFHSLVRRIIQLSKELFRFLKIPTLLLPSVVRITAM